ncbi:MAG TPA: hypothetical protein VGE97_06370 [Nitrososphaera sp.]|jgi:hypothetical protein
MQAILKIIKNTHRHPANQALHLIGAPFYAAGLVVIFGHFIDLMNQQATATTTPLNLIAGPAMLFTAIAMFVSGHLIEGNLGSITPVLIFRLLSRKVASYLIAQ